ncbi:MAG: DinB family protein [Planctomycetaceae bacterium]|nr:DinB family protein [Planctomycetaceae bacterium]
MSVIETYVKLWEFERGRTLALLDSIEESGQAEEILGWRPGPGRAHIAWQLMHIGVTEELFATERLDAGEPDFPQLVSRFKGGSTPDDDIPSVSEIGEVLSHSREHFLNTIRSFSEDHLSSSPTEFLQGRGWTLETLLQVIAWHEAHHQGQAHLTKNLWAQQNG